MPGSCKRNSPMKGDYAPTLNVAEAHYCFACDDSFVIGGKVFLWLEQLSSFCSSLTGDVVLDGLSPWCWVLVC